MAINLIGPEFTASQPFGATFVSGYYEASDRHGYTDHPIGNAITLVVDEVHPERFPVELAKVFDKYQRMPMLLQADKFRIPDQFMDSTVGYLCGGSSGFAEVLDSVRAVNRVQGGGLDRWKPKVIYGDSRFTFLTDEIVHQDVLDEGILSVPLYRLPPMGATPGETQEHFLGECERILEFIANAGMEIGVVLRTDDFNGDGSIEACLADMPIYDYLIRAYQPAWIHFFSDRRGNAIEQNPELRAWAVAFAEAVEQFEGRPSRYDFAQYPDVVAAILNKAGQNRRSQRFTQAELAYIREAVLAKVAGR